MKRRITLHHDGHGFMERIRVEAGEPATEPAGNTSSHRYEFFHEGLDYTSGGQGDYHVGFLQFQVGPLDKESSTEGLTSAAVIAALIDHHQGFQTGPLASRENALVVTKLQEALFWVRERADERKRRGVLGTMSK